MTALSDLRWGLEREAHRMTPQGLLSLAPHPEALRLPSFTRDFAETQLEIITQPHPSLKGALHELERLTRKARRAVAPDWLWPLSVPPPLPDDGEIPIARLGLGEEERRAVAYRRGLARRYGAARQMICGVHVNVSPGPALVNRMEWEAPFTVEEAEAGDPGGALLLRLARNLYRDLPVLILLLGASPFRLDGRHDPERLAVSYRNSSFGYARHEYKPFLDLSSLEAYLAGIRQGLRTESLEMGRLGLVREGQVIQLNPNVFQTDKEFYAPIRLRQTPRPGESTLDALARRGIGFLELRFPDVDPFQPAGIGEPTLRLLHLFLLDGLARPSIPRPNGDVRFDLDSAEKVALSDSEKPSKHPILFTARDRLETLERWARRLDRRRDDTSYTDTLTDFLGQVADPADLLSARLARFTDLGVTEWKTFPRPGSLRSTPPMKGVFHGLEYAGV